MLQMVWRVDKSIVFKAMLILGYLNARPWSIMMSKNFRSQKKKKTITPPPLPTQDTVHSSSSLLSQANPELHVFRRPAL